VTDIRCLSLSRPWPWAILHAGKRIENRSDKRGMPPMCHYRGPLLLHAAKSWDPDASVWMVQRGLLPPESAWKPVAAPCGSAVTDESDESHLGSVIFARCRVLGNIVPRRTDGLPWIRMVSLGGEGGGDVAGVRSGDRFVDYREGDLATRDFATSLDLRWWMGGYALVLADVEPTPLIKCRGYQGLWRPPPGVLFRLGEAGKGHR